MKNFDCLSDLELICALSVNLDNINFSSTSSSNLYQALTQIHKQLFNDNFKYANLLDSLELHVPGVVSSKQEEVIQAACNKLEKAINVIPLAALANFYYEFMCAKPFSYGNSLTVRIFICHLARYVNLNFDFRVLTNREVSELNSNKSLSSITRLFEKAINTKYSTKYIKIRHKWPEWPNASFEMDGESFLCFKDKYLVAIDGSLFPVKNFKELEANNYYINTLKYKKRIFPETLKKTIDGIPIDPRKVPLINLKQDILTGLHVENELPILISTIHKKNISMLELPERLSEIGSNTNSCMIANKAAHRLLHTRKVIKQIARYAFIGKQPTPEHSFFITMGGSGSGKGLLKNIALEASDNNLVEASLDKSRYFSFIYKLLIACEHHSDDYKIIAQFAYVLRDTILNYALTEGYNLLFDGSGIPYKGRYEHLVEIFKNSGFKTHVLVAETPFYHPNSKNRGIDSYHKIINRFRYSKDHRALPWKVAIEKHVGQPRSQLEAAADIHTDNFLIIDTLPKKEKTYILAFTKVVNKPTLSSLLKYKTKPQHLFEFLDKNMLLPTKGSNNINYGILDFIITTKLSEEEYKVLIITNRVRFLESLKKCLLNTESKGKEDIFLNSYPYLLPVVDFEFK